MAQFKFLKLFFSKDITRNETCQFFKKICQVASTFIVDCYKTSHKNKQASFHIENGLYLQCLWFLNR